MRTCIKCGTELNGRQIKYCSRKCCNNTLQTYACQKTRAEERKKQYVLKAGGKCVQCGYDKNLGALNFHHINPEEKHFELDGRSLSN